MEFFSRDFIGEIVLKIVEGEVESERCDDEQCDVYDGAVTGFGVAFYQLVHDEQYHEDAEGEDGALPPGAEEIVLFIGFEMMGYEAAEARHF